MNDERRRFCPRCGTALVADLPFCPGCGLNTAETVDRPAAAADAPVAAAAALTVRADSAPVEAGGTPIRRAVERASRAPSTILAALIVAAGLVVFGLLIRPQSGTSPTGLGGQGGGPGGAPAQTAALIVGLTIQSPTDGQVVATKEVTVIGLAPPGLTITRDVSFGLDQHATADGTGHWAINVSLNDGDNKLKFRIGDDRSTEQEIRVEYKPQG
jgi:hypothetical protein